MTMETNLLRTYGLYQQRRKLVPDRCPFCDAKITEFRDDLSRKEFKISGLCQKCQDSVFGRD